MRINEFINGIQVNDSNNIKELEIELNFDSDNNREAVTLTNFEFGVGDNRFTNDSYNILKKVLNDGINGGVGIVEGVPFLVQIDNQIDTKHDLIKGYIDLWGAEFGNGTIKATVVPEGGIDWLNDKVDSFSFAYLDSLGKINSNLYVDIPYCINKQNYTIDYFITILTIYFVTDKINEQINKLKDIIASLSNPFEATAIIRLILTTAYIIVLVTSLITLVTQLFNMIIQPVKYAKAMYTRDLLEIGFDYLGLKFVSSIYQQFPFNQEVILPEKSSVNSFNGSIGNLTPDQIGEKGYYNGTFGDLLRALKAKFNAKILINNGTVYFEKQNFTLSSPGYQLPDLLDSRYIYQLNKDDFKSNYLISFALDSNDKNTSQEYTGTSVQVIQTAIATDNVKMSLTKGLYEVRIPFALGKRKAELNAMEEILDTFFRATQGILDLLIGTVNLAISAVNALIDILNDIIDALDFIGIDLGFDIPNVPYISVDGFSNLISDRIGMLKMENDFVEIPKNILINSDGKIMDDNNYYLSAEYLYDNYHYLQSFVNGTNQYFLKEFETINFTFKDFSNVLNNNRIFDGQGNEAILLSLKYNPYNETATGRYKVKTLYCTNIQEKKIIPDGK